MFKSALEAFHWVHDFLFSKSPCQNCRIEYSKKPRDVEATQRKGGGVGKEKSLSLSASLSFTLTPATPRDDISTLSNLPQSQNQRWRPAHYEHKQVTHLPKNIPAMQDIIVSLFLLFLIFLSHKIKDGGQRITNRNK